MSSTATLERDGSQQPELKEAVIGIDLGTTNTCSAVQMKSAPEIFPLGGDKPYLSSIVSIEYSGYCKTEAPSSLEEESRRFNTDKPTTVVIGESARSRPKHKNMIFQSKLYIGRKYDDDAVQEIMKRHPFKVVEGRGGYAAFEIDGRIHSPEFIASLLLRKLKEVVDTRLQSMGKSIAPVKRVVIAVPAYFNQTRRDMTRIAAKEAGFTEVRIITEPCGAGVHFKLNLAGIEQYFLVADIGGGTTDLSLVGDDALMAELKVHNLAGDNQLGGEDFTAAIESLVEKQWRVRRSKPTEELTDKSKSSIHRVAEIAKLVLCDSEEAPFSCVVNGDEDDYNITATEFAAACTPLLAQITDCFDDIKKKAGEKWEQVECILLMGGGALLPMVQDHIAKETGKRVSKALLTSATGMTAVAGGCAAFAVPMSHPDLRPEGVAQRRLIEAIPYNLGIEDGDGKMRVLIERHTSIPTETFWDENFSFPRSLRGGAALRPYDDELKIRVLEGNSELAKNNHLLAERIFQRERPRGYAFTRAVSSHAEHEKEKRAQQVKIGFRVDRDMQLQVEARLLATDENCRLRVEVASAPTLLTKPKTDAVVNDKAQRRTLDEMEEILGPVVKKGRDEH